MKTVYLGTSEFAATVLHILAGSEHRPTLVVSQPDRPQGRGRKPRPPPVAAAARELKIELLQPEDVNSIETVAAIEAHSPDVLCMCAYGQLIKEPILDKFGLLNVHPSLLPRWRGAAPIERAIMAGDAETGVSIMRVVAALDAGDICLQARTRIEPTETGGALAKRLARLGGESMVDALAAQQRSELEFRPQGEDGTTYAEKIAASDRRLDLNAPAVEVARVARALSPHIGTYLESDAGERIKVLVAKARDGTARPGSVLLEEGQLLVGCGEGLLQLIELQPAGKRPMPAEAYLAGHTVPRTLAV